MNQIGGEIAKRDQHQGQKNKGKSLEHGMKAKKAFGFGWPASLYFIHKSFVPFGFSMACRTEIV